MRWLAYVLIFWTAGFRGWADSLPGKGFRYSHTLPAAVTWLPVHGDAGDRFTCGPQVAVKVESPAVLASLALAVQGRISQIRPNLYVVETGNARSALALAARLAGQSGVLGAHPVARRPRIPAGSYASLPNDPYFGRQWQWENRDTNGLSTGPDFNARAAWALGRGAGQVIAIVDDGVQLDHPDLVGRTLGLPHYNYCDDTTNGGSTVTSGYHGTAVAGWATATANNQRGISGLAPEAGLLSLVIYTDQDTAASAAMMQMFSNQVAQVQNHSWVPAINALAGPDLLEQAGRDAAFASGRGGLGTIMIHGAGNWRNEGDNVNNNGYANDPRVIAVGALRSDGRVASYSNPGACLLVCGLGQDDGFDGGMTTVVTAPLNEAGNYAGASRGTSATAAQLSGLTALLLSVNPALSIRDLQQVLLLSARHFDLTDPHLQTNGAGLRVSPATGFGVPDAGEAARLARKWIARPALVELRCSNTLVASIPDAGSYLVASGSNVPGVLLAIPARPALVGPHPFASLPALPVAYAGLASVPLATNLAGQAALIERGTVPFTNKIQNAVQAGAALVILFDNVAQTNLLLVGNQDEDPLPTLFISQTNGIALRDWALTNAGAAIRWELSPLTTEFVLTNTLLCEQVGLRIKGSHPRRGDLRVTLRSPAGTLSVLQRAGSDDRANTEDWTYWSVQHFYESSYGTWTAQVLDENPGNVGTLLAVELIVRGVLIQDANRDGLDDAWELACLHAAQADLRADPDGDGYSNLREFILGTDPLAANEPLRLDLSPLSPGLLRLSWPSGPARTNDLLSAPEVAAPMAVWQTVPPRFPETEWILPATNLQRFFQLRTQP